MKNDLFWIIPNILDHSQFLPLSGEMMHFDEYFSNGSVPPPTSFLFGEPFKTEDSLNRQGLLLFLDFQ